MSQFAGWVPFRRGILQPVLNDQLTGLEFLALTVLILLADAGTGGDRINAPLLCYFTGHTFNQDTAARILASLNDKGFIRYRGVRFSKKPQPYLVNGYLLTRGPRKGEKIRFSDEKPDVGPMRPNLELHGESTSSGPQISPRSDGDADDGTDGDADDGTDNYKKRNVIIKTQELSYKNIGGSTPLSASKSDSATAARDALNDAPRSAPHLNASSPCITDVHHLDASSTCITSVHHAGDSCTPYNPSPIALPAPVFRCGDDLPGYIFRPGDDPGYYSRETGLRITFAQAQIIAATLTETK